MEITQEKVAEKLQAAKFARISLMDHDEDRIVKDLIVDVEELKSLIRLGVVSEASVRLNAGDDANSPTYVWSSGDADLYDAVEEERWGYSR
jgi:hypothetical protein